jgi:anaerobic ribonucleoside-triphosphate reductase
MVHCKTASSVCTNQVMLGTGVKFERIRRITGYLVGTLDRFNDGKRAEERDRVKHCNMEDWR